MLRARRRLVALLAGPALLLAGCGSGAGNDGADAAERLPAAGLSKIEAAPDVPSHDTLAENPALVDRAMLLSAGLDLGYSRAASGDVAFRDVGAAFAAQADLSFPAVDTVRVSVDRALDPAVSAAFAWTAWRSDDNVDWTPVALAGPVAFRASPQFQFEIPIARTQARYVKVVAQPLPPGITTDPRYAVVFVTELQLYLLGAP